MKIIAKTLYGLERIVAEELSSLGAKDLAIANRAVIFEGELSLLYTLNYMSRTALAFLVEIASFRIRSSDDLYQRMGRIGWERYMDCEDTFSIVPVVKSEIFNHTGFAALRAKDAIVDYFRKREGRRPSVDNAKPDIVVNLHISGTSVTISLDSSLEPLFKRGYRTSSVEAPLNEVLAAGMIRLSGWKEDADFIDPMCGSGTISIEAALMACKIPPGSFRKSFGFQNWKDYDRRLFELLKERHDKQVKTVTCRFISSDISEQAVASARINIKNAGLEGVIQPSVLDFKDLKPEIQKGIIFFNPPYGERLLQGETHQIYGMIGTTLKHNFAGFTAWIISSNRESLKYIGLKPSAKHVLFNGSLECLFERFDMYDGSHKKKDS